ncbi:hypothetical protein [Verrucomicrobium sp. BvORR106]|uniref:hypothetical protein n=1 Tax=Verrucomicrobium sp. BvORR106 TaxID=1403819 RepID=UPI000571553E|nr:hypothetical protein [Verrucomicrobium sp. BvORR106]
MNIVRFTEVVKDAGKPEVYLPWKTPSRDAALRKLVAQHRVMTLMQPRTGTKKDWGEVGLGKNLDGQILVFPKSLKNVAGKRVVGIDYRLLKELPLAPRRRLKKVAPALVKTRQVQSFKTVTERKGSEELLPQNIIHLPPQARSAKKETKAESPRVRKKVASEPAKRKKVAPMQDTLLRRKARTALSAWKNGNQLPAYGLIQQLAEKT